MRLDVLVACFYMHARHVVSRLDAEEHRPLSGYALYESLLTYVAHLDLVGDPLQDTCHARVQDSLLRFVRYST